MKFKKSKGQIRAKKFPKSNLVNKSCYKKTIYPNETEAIKGMTMVWGRTPGMTLSELKSNLHAYKCVDGCDGWHFGHMEYYKKYLETLHGVK